MPRTTDAKVRGIVRLPESLDTAPFIEAASGLVDDVCGTSTYVAAKFERIERYLAAHFAVIHSPRPSTESAGSVSQQLEPLRVDTGLKLTKYGQQAIMLDTDGNLAAYDNAIRDVKGSVPSGSGGTRTEWVGFDRPAYGEPYG